MFFRLGRVPVKVGQVDHQTKLFPHVKIGTASDNVEDLLSSESVLKHEARLIISLQFCPQVSLQLLLQPVEIELQHAESLPALRIGPDSSELEVAGKHEG